MDVEPGADWKAGLSPSSLEKLSGALGEPSLAQASPGELLQFERLGYFVRDAAQGPGGTPSAGQLAAHFGGNVVVGAGIGDGAGLAFTSMSMTRRRSSSV